MPKPTRGTHAGEVPPAPLRIQGTGIQRADYWACALLALLVLAVFHRLPLAYWRADDPAILLHAIESGGLRAFYDAENWRRLSPGNLTPWLTLSFKTDWALAGLSPRFFYLHHLASLALLCAAVYALLRQWAPPPPALLGAGLFLAGAPTASVAQLLMTRHYLEGLLFALLALLGFLHAVRRGQARWAWLGAAAYLAATTAKEVYVPLLLILPVLPVGRLRERLAAALPFAGVAAFYVLWRAHMLGSLAGGYMEDASRLDAAVVLPMAQALANIPRFLFGAAGPPLAFLFATGWLWLLWRSRPLRPFVAVLGVAVLAPLIPLARWPGITSPDRYLFLPWFVLCAGWTCLACRIGPGRHPRGNPAANALANSTGCLLLAGLAAAALIQTHQMNAVWQPAHREFETQGRFIMQAGARQGFVPTEALLGGYWYATGLFDIKGGQMQPVPVALIPGLPVPPQGIDALYAYDGAQGGMADISHRIEAVLRESAAVDMAGALSIEARLERGTLHWRLGPYEDGAYYLASPRLGRYPIGRQGAARVAFGELAFQVQYRSPDGQLVSSPPLLLRSGGAVAWQRP